MNRCIRKSIHGPGPFTIMKNLKIFLFLTSTLRSSVCTLWFKEIRCFYTLQHWRCTVMISWRKCVKHPERLGMCSTHGFGTNFRIDLSWSLRLSVVFLCPTHRSQFLRYNIMKFATLKCFDSRTNKPKIVRTWSIFRQFSTKVTYTKPYI